MKRTWIAILLTLAMLLSLTACGKDEMSDPPVPDTSATEQTEPEPEVLAALRQEIDRRGLSVSIQVDGGIGAATAPIAAAAGADVAVMGSAVFNAPNPRELVSQVQAL